MTETTTIGQRIRALMVRSCQDESGATVIEYAMIASLIAVACIAAFSALGFDVGEMWRYIADKVGEGMRR
jgi:pilus assembly protein Flp/PilA